MKKDTPFLLREISKLNYKQINSSSTQKFTIGIIGTEEEVAEIKKVFMRDDSLLVNKDYSDILENSKMNKLREIIVERNRYDISLALNSTFCVSKAEHGQNLLRQKIEENNEENNEEIKEDIVNYIIDLDDIDSMVSEIIEDYYSLKYALPYNIPIFRKKLALDCIGDTSMQNATWVIGSAMPNIIPGPHQAITAVAEGVSDSVVLTVNELKMMVELMAISGRQISPMNCVVQYGIIAGMAKVAQFVATNLSGKMPAGAGIPVKASVAYGFTYSIGLAIYIYINTGEKVGKDFFEKNIKEQAEKIRAKMEEKVKEMRKR